MILDCLRNKTNAVIREASRIQKVGTTGVNNQEFNDMEESLNVVRNLIGNTTIRSQNLDALNDLANELAKNISDSAKQLRKRTISRRISVSVSVSATSR
ncbi:laminin subunit beta-1 [Lasius niger]|uniref:Laminin subunit beta-1 n=1 Tax=Lasius niger TaxID=67767 RepID=A0A0J7KBX2_LASNI|nr:laminin subunit beta-1 [Lasius niger]